MKPLERLRDGLGILGVMVLLGMLVAVVTSIPELTRYMRMRGM